MIEEQGWSASKEDVLAYQLLVWASDTANSGHSLEDAGKTLDADASVLYGILKEFWDSGLARDSERMMVPAMNSVFLTGAGSAAARKIATASKDGGKRRSAIRNGIVDWLSSVGEPSALSDFLEDSRASFFGVPYTQDEMSTAAKYLADKGIVKGIGAWGGELVRPSLTSEGLDCADSYDGNVQKYLQRGEQQAGHKTVNFIKNWQGVNIAAHSQHVNQSVGISQKNVNDIQNVAESFRQARELLKLDAEQDAELTQVAEEIAAEIARPAPDAGKLKGFLQTLHSIGVNAAGGAIGSVLAEHALTVMGSF